MKPINKTNHGLSNHTPRPNRSRKPPSTPPHLANHLATRRPVPHPGHRATITNYQSASFVVHDIVPPESPDTPTCFTIERINLRSGHLCITRTLNEQRTTTRCCCKHTGIFAGNSLNNNIHKFIHESFHGLPAVVHANGTQIWYHHGKYHRGAAAGTGPHDHDLPAIIHANGTQEWYHLGKRHRDHDLPAIIHANGTQEWYQRGELHRDHDRPAIVHVDITQL